MTDDALAELCWKLGFDIDRSARYHMRRQAFFDTLHRINSAVGVVFGSATMATLLTGLSKTSPNLSVYLAAIVTLSNVLDLVIGTSAMARAHAGLRARFLQLLIDIEDQELPDNQHLTKLKQRRLKIEMDEPPVMRALDTLCHNDLAHSYNLHDDKIPLPWFKAITAQWINWDCT